MKPDVAVLIPCYNEEMTVAKVVQDFRAALPEARIYVFDNASTDRTSELARKAGAVVMPVPKKGKGFAVRAMLEAVESDFYIMVDGDDTYPADRVLDILTPVMQGRADMVVGARLAEYTEKSFRPFHVAGNNLVRGLVNTIFSAKLTDILSGYRAFNARVRLHVPVVSSGFEVETELTVQMLYYGLSIMEVTVPYRERPPGSTSKLNTFRDGFRVMWKIFSLFRDFKPLTFFATCSLFLGFLGLIAGLPPIWDYATTRFVTHVPLAILAASLMLLAAGSFCVGLILSVVNWKLKEIHAVVVRAARGHGPQG